MLQSRKWKVHPLTYGNMKIEYICYKSDDLAKKISRQNSVGIKSTTRCSKKYKGSRVIFFLSFQKVLK